MTRGVLLYALRGVVTPPPPINEEQGIFCNLHFNSGGVAGFAKMIFSEEETYPSTIAITLLAQTPIGLADTASAQVDQPRPQVEHQENSSPAAPSSYDIPRVGIAAILALSPLEGARDRYAVQIADIDATNQTITTKVLKPRNVPILLSRWSLTRKSSEGGTGINIAPETTPWATVGTLTALQLPEDVQLSEDVSLIRLTNADLVELHEFRKAWFGMTATAFPIGECAVTIRIHNQYASHIVEEVATALQLFKSGHLERGLEFTYEKLVEGASELTPTAVYWSENSSYRDDSSVLSVENREMDHLRYWLSIYLRTQINTDSVMARVLRRFRRTYYSEDQHERVTDAVIGLEMLVLPGRQIGETGYRVSQRVSFMVSDDSTRRLEVAKAVSDAYDYRSAAVHSGGKKGLTIEQVDECVNFLRICIRRIMDGQNALTKEFCEGTNDNEKNRFYKTYISFGDFNATLKHWEETRHQPTKGQGKKKQSTIAKEE